MILTFSPFFWVHNSLPFSCKVFFNLGPEKKSDDAQEFVRLNLRIMTILGPFMLAVVLPLHFFFNKESRNHLDWLSCLDIGNVPRDTWLRKVGFWFKCAEYYVVISLEKCMGSQFRMRKVPLETLLLLGIFGWACCFLFGSETTLEAPKRDGSNSLHTSPPLLTAGGFDMIWPLKLGQVKSSRDEKERERESRWVSGYIYNIINLDHFCCNWCITKRVKAKKRWTVNSIQAVWVFRAFWDRYVH